MADHGTRTRYNQGCTDGPDGGACDPCVLANRDYFKKYQHTKKSKDAAEKLKAVPEPSAPELGPVEAAVVKTLEGIPNAEKRPDLVQSARAMARIQDNPIYVAQWTNAAKQQREIVAELLKGTERKGRLATVRQMTTPQKKTG